MSTPTEAPTDALTEAPVIYHCAKCSKTTDRPRLYGWVVRVEPVVVQGKTLGLCRECAGGAPPADPAGAWDDDDWDEGEW